MRGLVPPMADLGGAGDLGRAVDRLRGPVGGRSVTEDCPAVEVARVAEDAPKSDNASRAARCIAEPSAPSGLAHCPFVDASVSPVAASCSRRPSCCKVTPRICATCAGCSCARFRCRFGGSAPCSAAGRATIGIPRSVRQPCVAVAARAAEGAGRASLRYVVRDRRARVDWMSLPARFRIQSNPFRTPTRSRSRTPTARYRRSMRHLPRIRPRSVHDRRPTGSSRSGPRNLERSVPRPEVPGPARGASVPTPSARSASGPLALSRSARLPSAA